MPWSFSIDVGGTFTDVVARRPGGEAVTLKLLSTGAIRSTGRTDGDRAAIVDSRRLGEAGDFWAGYRLAILDKPASGSAAFETTIVRSQDQRLTLDAPLPANLPDEFAYELRSGEEAPVLAIRCLLGFRLSDPIGDVHVRLGTTRATNALLERKGARVAFVTTAGFGDVLKIGYQDRPDLFKLNIRKRDELAECSVEIEERLSADGQVLIAPDEARIREQLSAVRASGIEALAICFMHAHVNPAHEEIVARIAESVGFKQVSVSSRLSRLERIVPRGDTTVIDAYLSGVIREYVSSLWRSMPDARIQLMTSSGGLIDAALATGKDTILSGPAGGVIGCAYVSDRALNLSLSSGQDREAGANDVRSDSATQTRLPPSQEGIKGGFGSRTIGFDMGGTSTDVCRIEAPDASNRSSGRFEYQHETVKAGVRIQTPVLAIETVAAGGGSICVFDGQKLTVGPHSAGADPGPACYGQGGPLTITDVNVHLGRIVPDRFPFRLDRSAVSRRLAALAEEVYAATGSRLSPTELAEGFIKIANANMAAAIRKISIAKGYDPSEYTLTTFGGAGGQHACAIARSLGIRRVLSSPFAGVLSALGIGVANVRRIGERSVRLSDKATKPRSHEVPSRDREGAVAPSDEYPSRGAGAVTLAEVFDEITYGVQHELADEGIGEEALAAPVRSVDVCYAGQSTLITVPADPYNEIRERFEQMHEQFYGYCHCDRPIEFRVARVELSARGNAGIDKTITGLPSYRMANSSDGQITESFNRQITRSFIRDDTITMLRAGESIRLDVGQSILGPGIIPEPTSTIFVDSGWSASLLASGEILLTDVQSADDREQVSTERDPIRLELFNNQFAAIAEQMGETLRRTALSTNVKERLDFSCAIFTPAGELVVNAPHIPVHLGGMSDCVKCLIEDVDEFAPGDVYLTNDPFRGGSHLNDLTVVTPVHDDRGERIDFFVASRAHHAEIGGKRPGSMPPDSTCLAEEGVLIRAFRCVERGRFRIEELRRILTSDRHEDTLDPSRKRQPAARRREDQNPNRMETIPDPCRSSGGDRNVDHRRDAGATPPTFQPNEPPPLAGGDSGGVAFYPSRSPDENLADVAAQIAANQRGVNELRELIFRYGLDVVHAYMGHIQSAAEQKARAAIARLPRGTHRFTDYLDDGSPICLVVTIDGDRAVFDFSGTGPVLPGNLNANRSIVTSAVLYCLRCLIDEDIPLNSGVLAPVTIILPECFLNPPGNSDPRKCPAVAAGNVEASQRVVDSIFGALSTVAASQGTMNNLLIGNDRFGYYETICGGAGAGPRFDGADAVHTHMTNTRLTDPEVLESRYPLRLIRFAIRRDDPSRDRNEAVASTHEATNPRSDEASRVPITKLPDSQITKTSINYPQDHPVTGSPNHQMFFGGQGIVREIEFLAPLEVSIISQRRTRPPYGLHGGPPGEPGRNLLIRKSEPQRAGHAEAQSLPGICTFSANPGDRLIIETPGGGSFHNIQASDQ